MLRFIRFQLQYWKNDFVKAPVTHAPTDIFIGGTIRPIRPYEQKLNDKHYLAVHDAFKGALPDCSITAHVSRRAPYQAHMTVLTKEPLSPDQVTVLEPIVMRNFTKVSSSLPIPVLRFGRTSPVVTASWGPSQNMVITLGADGVTLDDINAESCNAEREYLRPSLGGYTPGFLSIFDSKEEPYMYSAVEYLRDLCRQNASTEPELRMPDIYLAAHIWYINEDEEKNILPIMMARMVYHNLPTMKYPLFNPSLWGEDLNLIQEPRNWLLVNGNAWAQHWGVVSPNKGKNWIRQVEEVQQPGMDHTHTYAKAMQRENIGPP